MSNKNKIFSILIPVYNEAKTIEQILNKILDVKLIYKYQKELIIVNDCSSDETESIILKFIEMNKNEILIKFLKHETNKGKGAAIKTGIEKITGEYVIIQDGDLEYNPKDYNNLLEYITKQNKKVVYGSRMLKKNKYSHFSFYLGGQIVTFFTNILYNQRLTDEPTCYKLFESNLLKSIPLKCSGFEFCPEVTAKISKLGIKINEIPIDYFPRKIEEGKKIKWYDGIEALFVLLKYRFFN